MKYTIYAIATGKIESIVFCSEESLVAMYDPLVYAAYPGYVEHDKYYISQEAVVEIPPSPGSNYVFDYTTKQWLDPRTLQDLQYAAWERIKASRENAIDAPLVTPYGTFDCKAKDRTNITDAVLLLQTLASVGTPTTIDFTLANNSTVTLTTAEMVTVGLLLGQKVQAAHAQARTLRAQIDAANSSTELEAIVWV